MDRRAFLRGMAVTAGGLLVPGAAVFDLGRGVQGPRKLSRLDWDIEIEEQVVFHEPPDFQLVSVDWVREPVNPACRFVEPVGFTDEAFQRQFEKGLKQLAELWEPAERRA